MTAPSRKGIVVGASVRGRMPQRGKDQRIEPFPQELVGKLGTVVPDGTLGHHVIDAQHVQVMFEGYNHPISCARWELEAVG